jgi:DNA repair protein RadC
MHLQSKEEDWLSAGSVLGGTPDQRVLESLVKLIGRCPALQLLRSVGATGVQQFDATTLAEQSKLSLRLAKRVVAARALSTAVRCHRMTTATCPAELFTALPADLVHLEREVLLGVALSAANAIKAVVVLSVGGVSGTSVVGRDVFVPMVRHAAAACILVHNHPSGDPTPSSDDVEFTRALAAVGALLGMPLVDHLVVARDGYRSLRELGLMPGDEGSRRLPKRK